MQVKAININLMFLIPPIPYPLKNVPSSMWSVDNLCKQFGPRSGPTEHQSRSVFTPFDTLKVSRQQQKHEKLLGMQELITLKYGIQELSINYSTSHASRLTDYNICQCDID